MKQALELATLLVFFCSGFAAADKPGSDDSGSPDSATARSEGDSISILAEAPRPPAEVPASRAARAEWQRRLELQRHGEAAPLVAEKESRKGRTNRKQSVSKKKPDSKKMPTKRNEKKTTESQKKSNTTKPQGKGKPGVDKNQVQDSDLPVIVPLAIQSPSYAAVRASIPFSRSEWEADPTYRHNGTMELMLGQLRDMVVYRYPPMGAAGPMGSGSGVTINNGGSQYPGFYNGFGGIPFGFNPGLNGVIQSRGIINSFQTQGFIGRGAPVLP